MNFGMSIKVGITDKSKRLLMVIFFFLCDDNMCFRKLHFI